MCQRTLLSKHLHGTFVPPRFATTLGDRKSELQDIEIKTVDGFQGREKEVIIFSTVRNQIHGPMNFIADERRLNVGLTRAKRGLIIVGNSDFLSSGSNGDGQVLARYAHFLKDRKYVLKLDDGLLRKVLDGNIGRR